MATFPARRTLLIAVFAVLLAAEGVLGREPIATAKFKAYTPWQAAWDAHFRSEKARLSAVDRQRQANDLMSWYGTYSGPYRATYRPRGWGQISYERKLSKSPIHVPFPSGPGLAYPHGGKVIPTLPYLNPTPPPVEQPVGHRKTWTSHNGYTYEPIYASSPGYQEELGPESANVRPRTLAPMPSTSVRVPVIPETIPTPSPLPETIPTPQPE